MKKDFERQLDDLWKRRTRAIRDLVRTRKGKPKEFTKKIRDKGIKAIADLSTRILLRQGAKEEFRELVCPQRMTHLSGSWEKRADRLLQWAKQHFSKPIIYSFWRKSECLYVGKGKSWRRLRHYRDHKYLKESTLIKVFEVRQKSTLAKAECLAVHRFDPKYNKKTPGNQKWGKKCPICQAHDQIRSELRALFNLR